MSDTNAAERAEQIKAVTHDLLHNPAGWDHALNRALRLAEQRGRIEILDGVIRQCEDIDDTLRKNGLEVLTTARVEIHSLKKKCLRAKRQAQALGAQGKGEGDGTNRRDAIR